MQNTNINTDSLDQDNIGPRDIMAEIIAKRRIRIEQEGHSQGIPLPQIRDIPLRPFLREPALICEIKHRSPSKGDINTEIDPIQQAADYYQKGVKTISVLTEQDYFGGKLQTLRNIKQHFPDLAILRKDFILAPVDVHISYLAGADAILLIASMHTSDMLKELYTYAKGYGLAVLVEVHSEADVDKIRHFAPDTVGINCRNLKTFHIDRLQPLILQPAISWNPTLVYESGIHSAEDADFAYGAGFNAVLCGEAVMKNPELVNALIQSSKGMSSRQITHPHPLAFWKRIAATIRNKNLRENASPLVKICGLRERADVECAHKSGADILGFVFAKSPRKVKASLLHELDDIDALKVAVVSGSTNEDISDTVAKLLQSGHIDAIQFHGDETPDICNKVAPYYKAIRLRSPDEKLPAFASPRILLDAWDEQHAGGTGKQINPEILAAWKQKLWLAGGLTRDNITGHILRWNPELVDVSSGVETSPGVKDYQSIQAFMDTIDACKKGSKSSSVMWQRKTSGKRIVKGVFNGLGGRYVSEMLQGSLEDLENAFEDAMQDLHFLNELEELSRCYTGRPTPLLYAENTSKLLNGAQIYVKLEGLANTGAHKINNALGQALLARRMEKKRIIAETGAGQHGLAVAAACARLKLDCTIYMGQVDVQRQRPNVFAMELFGAKVVPVHAGSKTLKDAVTRALQDWAASYQDTHYLIGSALGPSPYPDIVREFQSVIGRECKEQLHDAGVEANVIIASVGGGSNAMGIFSAFIEDTNVDLIGAEAGGRGKEKGNHASRMTGDGKLGIVHGYKSYFLSDDDGQIAETHSISAGLDYAGIGPELASLGVQKRVKFLKIGDKQALDALQFFARNEGLFFALESAHAAAAAIDLAKKSRKEDVIVVHMSGRGDKDIFILTRTLGAKGWKEFLMQEMEALE